MWTASSCPQYRRPLWKLQCNSVLPHLPRALCEAIILRLTCDCFAPLACKPTDNRLVESTGNPMNNTRCRREHSCERTQVADA
eukprot:6190206-Pleurochrysis_carterae.AAC.3